MTAEWCPDMMTKLLGEIQDRAARLYRVTGEREAVVTSMLLSTPCGVYRIIAVPEPAPQLMTETILALEKDR